MDKFVEQAGAYLRYSQNCTNGPTVVCVTEAEAKPANIEGLAFGTTTRGKGPLVATAA